jgi:AcrR family transcriptional regulator
MATVDGRAAPRADRRSRRTRRMVGEAFVALLQEQRYDTITVQEIIDRANVGRSTFYAHYLDKEDLLQSEIAGLVERLSAHMDAAAGGARLLPSLALLRHLQERQDLYRALARGRAIDPALRALRDELSRRVETRLAALLPAGVTPAPPLPVVAQHVAGALLAIFGWWLDRGLPEPAEQIDAYFLALVRPTVRAATGVEI